RFLGALLGAAAGEPGEDLELTLALVRSIVASRRVDLDDIARGYLKWFSSKPKDVGPLTRAALENLRAGDPPAQCGVIAWEDSGRKAADNESLKRCVPVGLLHIRRLDGLREDAADVSRITHSDPRCVGACAAVATAVAHLVRGGPDADEAVERAASAAGEFSDDARAVVERAGVRKPSDLNVDGPDR